MKSFEKLVLSHRKDITGRGPVLDPLQFAYRSVDDAINMGRYYILKHLDSPGTYARILFLNFSQLTVPASTCQWLTNFLTDRRQQVRLWKIQTSTRSISTGAAQGCVLFPLLFSLGTNDCTSRDPSVKLLKFADDTTVISLIRDGDESAYKRDVEQLTLWCGQKNLGLNTLKTAAMTVDFRSSPPTLPPFTIFNNSMSALETCKFLGSSISRDLKWAPNIDSIIKKAQQRMYFLH